MALQALFSSKWHDHIRPGRKRKALDEKSIKIKEGLMRFNIRFQNFWAYYAHLILSRCDCIFLPNFLPGAKEKLSQKSDQKLDKLLFWEWKITVFQLSVVWQMKPCWIQNYLYSSKSRFGFIWPGFSFTNSSNDDMNNILHFATCHKKGLIFSYFYYPGNNYVELIFSLV